MAPTIPTEDKTSSLMLYAMRHKLKEYLDNEFREEINKKIDALVEEAVSEFSVNVDTMKEVFSLDTRLVITTLFNGKEMKSSK